VPNTLNNNTTTPKPAHLKSFVAPSVLRITGAAKVSQSVEMHITESTALIVTGTLDVDGILTLDNDATLWLKAGSVLNLGPYANLTIGAGCHVFIDPSATINTTSTSTVDFTASGQWNQNASQFVEWETGELSALPINTLSAIAQRFGSIVIEPSQCSSNGSALNYCNATIVAHTEARGLPGISGAWMLLSTTPTGVTTTPTAFPSGTSTSFSFNSNVTSFTLRFHPIGQAPIDRVFNVNYNIVGPTFGNPNAMCICFEGNGNCPEDHLGDGPGEGGIQGQRYRKGYQPSSADNYSLGLYPNPATNQAKLRGLNRDQAHTVKLFSTDGKQSVVQLAPHNLTLDLSPIRAGIYMVQVSSSDQVYPPFKLVKQ